MGSGHSRYYTKKQVAEITGLTPRQVTFYTEKELVINPGQGKGRHRQYTTSDIAEFGIIKMLFDYGIKYRPMKAMLRQTMADMIEILNSFWDTEKKFDQYLNVFTREDGT
ncbi:MAG: MerR family transcriptional regulator, partial [Desulfobacterales bacterium]|nr:MerR family transcriptional regulator [Desulfobacterales bacterium]